MFRVISAEVFEVVGTCPLRRGGGTAPLPSLRPVAGCDGVDDLPARGESFRHQDSTAGSRHPYCPARIWLDDAHTGPGARRGRRVLAKVRAVRLTPVTWFISPARIPPFCALKRERGTGLWW